MATPVSHGFVFPGWSEGDGSRQPELHFRPGRRPARQRELAADAARSLAHARQAPMAIAPGVQDVRVDAAAIVA